MGDWLRELADARGAVVDLHPTRETMSRRAAVGRAMRARDEAAAFERRWPAPPSHEDLAPSFTWSQLERQLADLADSPMKAAMARDLISGLRKMSQFKPPEMVLREILCTSWALLDEGFQPELDPDYPHEA
ncbi:hypothetical protein [Phenylobacterium sp.]|uniref:hypothetical protein n=1 Tax=Phenylobacterium sp. TaxID=1871053 RepID=UPI0025EFD096|nr:hypothetical protein [Phenylobacterium sp.]